MTVRDLGRNSWREELDSFSRQHEGWIVSIITRSSNETLVSTCEEFADITDETVCARMPEPFSAVGLWYRDFSQTTDEEVRASLQEHAQRIRTGSPSHD